MRNMEDILVEVRGSDEAYDKTERNYLCNK